MSVADKFIVSNGTFVLQLEPAEDGSYCVTSPFDPELFTQADSLEEAFENAADAAAELKKARTKPVRKRTAIRR